jgi:hypothetical protein
MQCSTANTIGKIFDPLQRSGCSWGLMELSSLTPQRSHNYPIICRSPLASDPRKNFGQVNRVVRAIRPQFDWDATDQPVFRAELQVVAGFNRQLHV